jgi:hypothetical protein
MPASPSDLDIIGTRRPDSAGLPLFDAPLARAADPATSHQAGHEVRDSRKTLARALLAAYRDAYPRGLTAEEAATAAGVLHTGYWKRCSDLRKSALIVPTGETRVAFSGMHQDVCVCTDAGRIAR